MRFCIESTTKVYEKNQPETMTPGDLGCRIGNLQDERVGRDASMCIQRRSRGESPLLELLLSDGQAGQVISGSERIGVIVTDPTPPVVQGLGQERLGFTETALAAVRAGEDVERAKRGRMPP